jgi:hypothetical protein
VHPYRSRITSPRYEAYALAGLGRCELAEGRVAAAVEQLGAALTIFERLGAAEAADVAAELQAIDTRRGQVDG